MGCYNIHLNTNKKYGQHHINNLILYIYLIKPCLKLSKYFSSSN